MLFLKSLGSVWLSNRNCPHSIKHFLSCYLQSRKVKNLPTNFLWCVEVLFVIILIEAQVYSVIGHVELQQVTWGYRSRARPAWYWPWVPPRRRTAPPRWSAPAAAPGCGRQRCSWRTYNDPHVNTPTLKLWLIVDESLSSCKRLVKELRTQTLSQQLLTLLLALVNRYTSRIGLEEWLKISQIQRPKTLAIWTRFLKYYDYQDIKG